MNAKTPLLLVLTTFFVLILCGAASAGTPLAENQTGTVSGDLYVNTTDGWPSSTQGATNIVTQANTVPAYTSIDSAWVYVNVYSGSGSSNWPVRTTVKLDGNGDGDYDDADETLGVEDMNIPGSPDGTVYWLNDHCMRVYSDYQVWYNVTGLVTSNNPTLYVKTENMGGDGYDGRIKLLTLTVAYNDGDTDQVDYWVLNGQDWINASSSPSSSTFNTDQVPTGFTNATLNTVALSSTDGTYTLNTSSLTGNLTETGSYYKEHQWDVTSNINTGSDTTLTYANVGASLKLNLATLTIREPTAAPAPIADFTASPTSGTAPLIVTFTDASTNTPTNWAWTIEGTEGTDFQYMDSTSSTSQNPHVEFLVAGTYEVMLVVTNDVGSDDEIKMDYITVNTPVDVPVAAFSADRTTGTPPVVVRFTDESANSPTIWSWNFGDGKTSTVQNPSHIYTKAGDFTVTLTVTNSAGSDIETRTGYISTSIKATPVPVWTDNSAWSAQTELSYLRPCLVDLDADGDYDMLVGDSGGVAYGYENTGSATSPVWTANSAWNTPDAGSQARPAAADLDGDGDFDLLIALNNGMSKAFENTGTAASPVWTARTEWDPVDVGAHAKPALADLDNDGDYDLLIGERYGISFAFENTGTASSPVWTARSDWDTPDLGSFSIGDMASPAFADIDGDGDFDLMIANIVGVTYGYENTGSSTGPVWTAKSAWDIPARTSTSDYSSPCLADLDADGDYDLLKGTTTASTIYSYENTGTAGTPVADFSADPTSGEAPLTVTFTDLSSNIPTSWAWTIEGTEGTDYQYVDETSSASQNPHVVFLLAGTYDVTLTATNSAGSDVEEKTGYIEVMSASQINLMFTGADGPATVNPSPAYVFAREPNTVQVKTIKNSGTETATDIVVALYASDVSSTVPVNITTIATLAGGETAYTVIITDPTDRNTAGASVTYTAVLDPDNLIAETDEIDNTRTSRTFTVLFNGYKCKRYWEGGSDVTTKKTYDIHGGLVYSFGDSSYHGGSTGGSGGWSSYTVTWMAEDLPIPNGGSVKEARLYVPYTWDNTNEIPDRFHVIFNGNDISSTYQDHYQDRSNFGGYSDHDYGLLTYDVTTLFNSSGNTALLSKDIQATKVAMYGLTLAVVYEKVGEPHRQIFINEEFDLLGADASMYATIPEEATAYIPFTGLTINMTDVAQANLVTFVPSGNMKEGDLLFNGETIATNVWDYGLVSGPQVSIDVRDVAVYLLPSGNEAGVRSTAGANPCLAASQQFLIVEYTPTVTTPVAAFSGTPTTGTVPLHVTFTNTSTDATTYAWDFDNNGTTDSTDTNPTYTYNTPGTYTVKLTATGPGGIDEETKTNYITVSGTPDLVTSDLQMPSNPVIATAYPVSATVTNGGNGDAASFVVKLYDNNIQVAKTTLASLASGESTPVSFIWTPSTTGEHVLAVIADANSEITEYNETNNQVSTQTTVNPSTQPDLIATNLQLPASPTVAISSQVTATITNNGTVDSGAFVVKLYDNNTQIAKINLTGLSAGASTDVTFDWLTYTSGAHNLSVIADANQQITEYNENNNQISQAVTVNPSNQPDLTVTDLQLPDNPVAGNTYQITATITNLGTVDAGAFAVKLYDNNTQLGKINITSLSAGTSTQVIFNWTPATGTHNLAIKADANNQITEYNENNNQITQQATVN